MITLISNKASKPIEVRCDENLREQGQWLADTVADFEARGRILDDGVAVDIGWTTFVLRAQPDGSLRLCEPNYDADPFKTLRPEVTLSLTVLAAQIDLVRAVSLRNSLNLEAVPCRFDQKLVVRKGALDEPRVFANRQQPSGEESGWYVGPAQDGSAAASPQAEDLESLRVYQLLERRPTILYALALPVGYTVIWSGHNIEALADPQGRNLWHQTR
jgi:hypothetical protein